MILNGQVSSSSNIEAGVLQRPILRPLSFLIYINDLSDKLTTNTRVFADDVPSFIVVDNINFVNNQFELWLKQNKCLGKPTENVFQH